MKNHGHSLMTGNILAWSGGTGGILWWETLPIFFCKVNTSVFTLSGEFAPGTLYPNLATFVLGRY